MAILLVAFAHSDKPIKSTLRNAVVTLLAITIALSIGDRTGGYSDQSNFVAIILVQSLCQIWVISFLKVVQTWTQQPRPMAGDKARFYVWTAINWGLAAATIWIFSKGLVDSRCKSEQHFTSDTGVILKNICIGLQIPSIQVANIALIYLGIDRNNFDRRQKVLKLALRVAIILWVLSFPLAFAACEVLLTTFGYRDSNGQVLFLRADSWGLGQVIALVMLALQLFDASTYLREPSHQDETQSRFRYWWITKLIPLSKRILKCITGVMYVLTFSS